VSYRHFASNAIGRPDRAANAALLKANVVDHDPLVHGDVLRLSASAARALTHAREK
jgi:hypothetical protein